MTLHINSSLDALAASSPSATDPSTHVMLVCGIPQLADAICNSLHETKFPGTIFLDTRTTSGEALFATTDRRKEKLPGYGLMLVAGAPIARSEFGLWLTSARDLFIAIDDSSVAGYVWLPGEPTKLGSENGEFLAIQRKGFADHNVTVSKYPHSVGPWLRDEIAKARALPVAA